MKRHSGATLTELMIAVAVISVSFMAFTASFSAIQKAVQMGKNKTLASNLAQEKMQILMQKTYLRILPTPYDSYSGQGHAYDNVYFPPESITEGTVNFQRLTYVQVVTESTGTIIVLPPTTPDTGMRQITVTVEWYEFGQPKYLQLKSVISNPNTVETNAVFAGQVTDTGGNPIQGALVNVAENLGWRNVTNSGGYYSFNVMPGNYNLVATADGYFSSFAYKSVAPNNTTTVPFTLTAMSSGSVVGTAWMNTGPVISQVVASTTMASGMIVQYIELFNPTFSTITMISAGTPGILVNYQTAIGCGNAPLIKNDCEDPTWGIKLNYVNSVIPPYSYYVVANTTTFTVNGTTIAADAYFADNANTYCGTFNGSWNTGVVPPVKQIITIGHGGVVWLSSAATGAILDVAGWKHNGNSHPKCDPYCYDTTPTGLPDNMQLVRASSPTYYNPVYGRAYDSSYPSVDFTTSTPLFYPPFSTAQATYTIISGRPAVGAVVTASDGLSDPTSAVSVGQVPIANFYLPQVATGTWTVLITSHTYELENDTVSIAATGSIYTFPSSMTVLSTMATAGFISGRVVDAFGLPINVPSVIKVSANGAGTPVNADGNTGRYLLRVSTGNIDVTANSAANNPNYISVSSLAVYTQLGEISNGVDFILSQGGRVSGFVTRDGINALPGISVAAINANGDTQDTEVTDTNGKFTTTDITTGSYTIVPQLDTLETSTPTYIPVTVLLGQNVFSGTFTIVGALGTITGTVKTSSQTISTGVLIIVTTTTFSGSPPAPPALSTSTSVTLYNTSSWEDGTYSIDVRQSTNPTYNVYGYYTSMSSAGVISTQWTRLTGVSVLAGQTVSGENFSW